jgi:hypothetical protein
MKLIIAGTRTFDNYKLLKESILKNINISDIEEIVSGTAKGADSLGELFAFENDIPVKRFPANWEKYGKSAGYRRNVEMAEYGDTLLAFWDGVSKGTLHMINIAKNKNLKVFVIKY